MNHKILQPISFFHALGGLHDAALESLAFKQGELMIAVDDIFINSRDWPGKGILPDKDDSRGVLHFKGLKNYLIQLNDDNVPWIYDLEVKQKEDGSGLSVEIKFSPGGLITFTCTDIDIECDLDPQKILDIAKEPSKSQNNPSKIQYDTRIH